MESKTQEEIAPDQYRLGISPIKRRKEKGTSWMITGPSPVAAVVAFEWLKTSALPGLHLDLVPSFPSPTEVPVPCSCLQQE
ncbi:hypothetical protein MC885_020058 [Smutsia gigantea]|nr:hypothetical protein MC885_020058 [Smutsia gigantea]